MAKWNWNIVQWFVLEFIRDSIQLIIVHILSHFKKENEDYSIAFVLLSEPIIKFKA